MKGDTDDFVMAQKNERRRDLNHPEIDIISELVPCLAPGLGHPLGAKLEWQVAGHSPMTALAAGFCLRFRSWHRA
jgi:hypothetical protein